MTNGIASAPPVWKISAWEPWVTGLCYALNVVLQFALGIFRTYGRRNPETIASRTRNFVNFRVARDSPTGIASHLWRRVKPQMRPVLTFGQFV
jgi:hypothetical protein